MYIDIIENLENKKSNYNLQNNKKDIFKNMMKKNEQQIRDNNINLYKL
jgi:hypothetical protein